MRNWPHSPAHCLSDSGAYIVTASTYRKERLFCSPSRLDFLCGTLLDLAAAYGWDLQAWAVFSNHYHFVALAPSATQTLRAFLRHLHSVAAREINRLDNAPGRKVWFQYWDTHLRYEKAYFARLSYVHKNALHHGLVREPSMYPWCSAGWFERKATPAFYRTVMSFPCERVNVPDDYAVDQEGILDCGGLPPPLEPVAGHRKE